MRYGIVAGIVTSYALCNGELDEEMKLNQEDYLDY